jgi:hypothetical protein
MTTNPFSFYGLNVRDVLGSFRKLNGGHLPLAGNTTPTPPPVLEPAGMTKLADIFAPLRAFATVFDLEPKPIRTQRIIKYNISGSTTLVDTTNFEQGDGDVESLTASVSHYSQPWQVSNKDLNSGIRQSDLFYKNAEALAATLMAQVSFYFNTATFPNTAVTSANASFGMGEAAQAFASVPGPKKALLLNSTAFGLMAHASGRGFVSGDAVHGWKNGVFEVNNGWAGKVYGIALAPPAIVCVLGVITGMEAVNLKRSLIGVPGLDLILENNEWFNAQTRTRWQSLDCIFGPTSGQSNAATIIQTP